ncbi:MAG: CDP-glucose 4,6-dehydratase [Zoogloea sp.]|uniref:CDP-glucose 4,6-dehydratase n=1 Tax=Zoogloea sp. TaxID=49181 RepID=UPI003F395EB8
MENLVTPLVDPGFWAGRRVFLTGHTGFKGSWLALWLHQMGAEVQGYALAPPNSPNLFALAGISELLHNRIGDLRDGAHLRACLTSFAPEVVLHLGAQALVSEGYADPVGTFATNVQGTVNLLEAVRYCPSVGAVVVVSSDKCYENREYTAADRGYHEDEPMGGYDPYSASKGCTELVVSAYRRSFLLQRGVPLASARAGNVIGGGDWSPARLVPDVLAAFSAGRPVLLRNPDGVRPWQHVLDPLAGYLALAQRLHQEGAPWAEGWNFGPTPADARSVGWVVEHLARAWGPDACWDKGDAPIHEAGTLRLDCHKAHTRLGWQPRWDTATALDRSLAWFRAWQQGADMRQYSRAEIDAYCDAPGLAPTAPTLHGDTSCPV